MNNIRLITLTIYILISFVTSANAERFRTGVIAPLSGPIAEYGIAAKNGIELAKLQHPELYSNIDFVYEDSQWDLVVA